MIRLATAGAALALLGLGCSTQRLSAQVRTDRAVSGIVISADGAAVAQARVVLEAEPAGRRAVAWTDGAGRFTVRAARDAAAYTVSISAEGHHPSRVRLTAAQVGAGTPRTFMLDRPIVPLAPLAVRGTGSTALQGLPGATLLIDRAALRAERPAAAHEMLRRSVGVHAQEEDALGLHLNIGIRGLDPRRSSRVLLLEDGVPIHLGPYTDPTAHYQPPAETLQRIEVLRGAGQVAYGPQTVGGVVNFVRMPPPASPAGLILMRAGDRGRVGGHLLAGTGLGRHATSISLNRRHAAGPRRGADHAVTDASAQLLLELSGAGSLLLRLGAYTESSNWGETGLTQTEFETDPFQNPSPRDVFELQRHAAQLVHRADLGGGAELFTSLYGQDLDRTSWRQASSSSDRFGTDRYRAAFGCPDDAAAMADCGFQGRPRQYRFAGLEPRLRWSRADAAATVDVGGRIHVERAVRRQLLGTVPGDARAEPVRDNALTATAYSTFAQARVTRGHWTLTSGVRLEHVHTVNRNRLRNVSGSGTYTRVLPGLGLTRDIGGLTLFAGTHRGFAPPRPADVLSAQPGESLVQVEPEVSWNHEFGARAQFPGVVLEATAFRTDFSNQIVEGSRTGSGQRFVNAGTTLHQGLEVHAALAQTPRALRPLADVSWTWVADARYTSDHTSAVDGSTSVRGNRLPFAPRHLLHASAGMATAAGFQLSVRASYTGEQFADDLNTRAPTADGQRGALPAYTIFGATANRLVAGGRATVFATIDNLRNTVYITERLEGVMVGSPRRVSAGIEWLF